MVRLAREGSTWRIGTDAEVAWIANSTSTGRTISAAIPPGFEAYATLMLPYAGHGQNTHDRAVLGLLSEQSPGQRWWLGYPQFRRRVRLLETAIEQHPVLTGAECALVIAFGREKE